MELGTGIFLSALFLGTVALFLFTKDRWNWKKVSLYVFGIPVAAILICGGGYYAYYKYEQGPRPQTEFMGFSLGMSKEDVLTYKGLPLILKSRVSPPASVRLLNPTELPEGYTIDPSWLTASASEALSIDEWIYQKKRSYSDEISRLLFLGGSLSRITSFSDSESILGVRVGGSYNAIINRLGEPENISDIEKGDVYVRHYYYKKFNLEFVVEKGKVKSITVGNAWFIEPSIKG